MATIDVEIRQRRAALVDLQRSLRRVDSVIETSQRLISRVRGRRRYLPDQADADRLSGLLVSLAQEVSAANQVMKGVLDVFRF